MKVGSMNLTPSIWAGGTAGVLGVAGVSSYLARCHALKISSPLCFGPALVGGAILGVGTTTVANFLSSRGYLTSMRDAVGSAYQYVCNLAQGKTVRNEGRKDQPVCPLKAKALELNPQSASDCIKLGDFLKPGEEVEFGGQSMNNQACYLKALSLNPKSALAYQKLGDILSEKGTVQINGQKMDKRACRLKALSLTPKSASVYEKIGDLLPRRKTLKFEGEEMNQRDYYVKALSLNPKSASVYKKLAVSLRLFGGTVLIEGQEMDQRACSLKAKILELNPQSASDCIKLGDYLKPGETVEFGGQRMDQQACYSKAQSLKSKS